MAYKYDDFFKWLSNSDWKTENIRLKQDVYFIKNPETGKMGWTALLKLPDSVNQLEFRGLFKLSGNNLYIGVTGRKNGNETSEVRGAEFNSLEEMGVFNLEIFEIPSGKEFANGAVLPLVARIAAGPGGELLLEYCASAKKYLGI